MGDVYIERKKNVKYILFKNYARGIGFGYNKVSRLFFGFDTSFISKLRIYGNEGFM